MKTIITLGIVSLLATGVTSCKDRNDDNELQDVTKIKIDSVNIPSDTMQVFAMQSIRTYSTYSSGCNGFYDYDYIKSGLNREVTAYQFITNGPCTQSAHTDYAQFNFSPVQTGTYTFKFWNGDNSWITRKIVVTQ